MTRRVLLFICIVVPVLVGAAIAAHFGNVGIGIVSAAALICSVLIAARTLGLQIAQHEEPWMRTFREVHREFWDDADMAEVRAWIACDDAYKEVQKIVEQRSKDRQVSKEQYASLEKIDKFCSLMIRVARMSSKTMSMEQKEIWQSLYYAFWLSNCRKRIELGAYIRKYWPSLKPYLDTDDDPIAS